MQSDKLLEKKLGGEFTVEGEWWLPRPPNLTESEFKRFGTLTFDPDNSNGISLDVAGWLEPDIESYYELGKQFTEGRFGDRRNVIWGSTTESELISLFGCYMQGHKADILPVSTYHAHLLFASNRVWLNTDELKFETLNVTYSHLHDWVGKSALHTSSFDPKKEQTVSLDKTHLITSAEVGDYVISIGIGAYASFSGSPPTTAEFRQNTCFHVKQKDGEMISCPELFRLQSGINNFLSLTSNEPIFPLTIDVTAPVEGEQPATARVLFEPVRTSPKKTSSGRHMLFTYNSVANIFENALQKVIEDENMQPLYNQFFAEFRNPSTFVEDRFMAIIRAIEVFHRRVFDQGYYVPEDEYKDGLRKDLEEVVNDADIGTNFRKSLCKKLEYGYEY